MTNKDTSSYKVISTALRQQRKNKQKSRFRKVIVILVGLIIVSAFLLVGYKLDQSSLFRVSAIIVNNNQLYEDEEILAHLKLAEGQRIWLIHPFLYKNKALGLNGVEDLTLKKQGNILLVEVLEQAVVGYKDEFLLVKEGYLIRMTDFNEHFQKQVPIIVGFDDDQLLNRLGESLSKLNPEVLLLVASIEQVTTTYDHAQLWLLLTDQKQVYSDFRSLELLNDYPLFVDQIAPENNCIYLDYTSSSARSSPCE